MEVPVAQWSEHFLPGGKDLGSNPSLVIEAWLREGHPVMSCDKLQNWADQIMTRMREGKTWRGSKDPDRSPWDFWDNIQQRLWGRSQMFHYLLIKFPDKTLSHHFGCGFLATTFNLNHRLIRYLHSTRIQSIRNLRCCLAFSGETYHLTSTWRAFPFTHAEKFRH